MRLIDANELCNGLLDRWKTADENNEELIKHLMADVVTPIVVSTPTVDVLDKIRAEIADLKWDDYLSIGGFKKDVLQIIDKYKGE